MKGQTVLSAVPRPGPRSDGKGTKRGIVVLVLWTLVLLGILLAPIAETQIPTPYGFRHFDKVAHFGLFVVTGFVSVFGASFFNRFASRMFFGTVFSLFLAVGTEFAQSFIPLRNMSLWDLLADGAGVGAGLLIYALFYRRHISRL
jgi:VanZ family protein